jgi:hypothetical protein
MTGNVYRKLLAQAAQYEGSTQALAGLLRVPEKTLERWMQGKAHMPLRAFYKLMEVLAQHEQEGAGEELADADAPLTFAIGRQVAQCSSCGGQEFARVDKDGPLRFVHRLRCLSCDTQVVHGDLVAELARRVSIHAAHRLDRVRGAVRPVKKD